MQRFRRTRTIEARDIDALDHVNNVVWLGFVVDLAQAHSRAVGLDGDAYRRAGGVWVARRHEIEYSRSALLGDEVVEETWVETLGAALSVRRARFSDAEDRELVTCRTEWAFVDRRTMRPRRLPRELRSRFETAFGLA